MAALKAALRSFRSAPALWLGVVLSIALGTGANVALFSVVNGLMLRPLPVRDPSGLAIVRTAATEAWSYPVFRELQTAPAMFEGTAAWAADTFNGARRGRVVPMNGLYVSGGFFDTLGVSALYGRLIGPDDDRKGGGSDGPVAVISHRYWQQRFAGDPDVLERRISIGGVEFTIVGITPRTFFGPEVGTAFDVAIPLATEPMVRKVALADQPFASWLTIMVRIAREESLADAASRLRQFQPALRERVVAGAAGADEDLNEPLALGPAGSGVSALREQYRRPLLVLAAVAGLVLLIACANVAHLLSARALSHAGERSLRVALGASAGRLVREMCAEAGVMIGLGGLAGILLAQWAGAALVRQVSLDGASASLDLPFDWRVFAFAGGIIAVTAVASSLIPAWRLRDVDPVVVLGGRSARITGGGHRAAHVLLVLQIAFTTLLLVTAGLFTRTFVGLLTQPLGVERDKVLVVRVEPEAMPGTPDGAAALYDQLLRTTRALPGVEQASLSAMTPLGGATIWQLVFEFPDAPLATANADRTVTANVISGGFFATFGTSILAGREFSAADGYNAPPVAIVNRAFVAKFMNATQPLGRRIRHVGFGTRPSVDREIVGVVENAAYTSLRETNLPTIYVPLPQRPQPPLALFVGVRSSLARSAPLSSSVVDALSQALPEASYSSATLAERIDAGAAQERVVAGLSMFFGVLALLLAGLGLHGVTAHVVGRRRPEIGVRIALGATPADVVVMIFGRVAVVVLAGVVSGLALSVVSGRFLAALLYGLAPGDGLTMALAAAAVAAVAVLASAVPTLRAARLSPADIMRARS